VPHEPDRIKEIFLGALDLTAPPERAAYLEAACGGDLPLRHRLEALLKCHDRSNPLLDCAAADLLTAAPQPAGDVASSNPTPPADEVVALLSPAQRPGSLGRLGHYEVLEVLGRGGMGVVFRAFDDKLHRVVAIKVLAGHLASNGSARQRFVREARAAAAVTHDNVIEIYAVEDAGPVPYLVMRCINGRTLQDKLDRSGPLELKEILRIGLQIAEGLDAAHRQGLIHRDIKPANILLDNSVERVKITDFGLARAVDDASVSQSGLVAGTPLYMSPEQARGEPLDPRSDLFSLGSVLYTMCAGHPPFRAASPLAVLKRVCEDTPRSLRDINPAIPAWLEAIVARLQSKDLASRFATAKEVARLLSRGLKQVQTGAESSATLKTLAPHRAPWQRSVVAVVAVLALIGGGVAWWFLAGPGAGGPAVSSNPATAPQPWQPRAPLTQEELARLPDPLDAWRREAMPPGLLPATLGEGKEAPPELMGLLGAGPFRLPSPGATHWPAQTADGRLLALSCGKTVVLYDTQTGGVVRTLTGHTERAFISGFSSDGKRVACGSINGFIKVWDVASGKEEPSCEDAGNHVYTTLFSRDGKQLVSAGSQGVVKVWDATTGQEVKTLGKHGSGVGALTFNPDRTRLASGGADGLVKIWDWAKGELLTKLEGQGENVQKVAYSPDGTLLATGSQSRVMIWDATTFQPLPPLSTTGGGFVAFTPDGQTLVTAPCELSSNTTKRAFLRWDVKTGKASGSCEVAGTRNFLVGDLSVDGRTVYLMSCDPPEPRLGVYDAVTGKERFPNQGGHAGPISSVAFSPDGRLLASGGKDGRVCLWDLTRRPSRESGWSVRELSGHKAAVVPVAFSPDGRLLASGSIDGTIRLWDVADGREVHRRAVHPGHLPLPVPLAFSPDGETVAGGGPDGTVHLLDVKTRQPKNPLPGHFLPVRAVAYSPDGRWLASGGADRTVQLVERASGRGVHTFPGETQFTGLAFSPDSQTLAAVCDAPGPLRLWDLATEQERTFPGHTQHVLWVAFHPAGNRVVTGSLDGTVRLWVTAPGTDGSRVFDFPQGGYYPVAFAPSGRHFAVGLANGTIAILATPAPVER
jgi:WD40 repeat protein